LVKLLIKRLYKFLILKLTFFKIIAEQLHPLLNKFEQRYERILNLVYPIKTINYEEKFNFL